MYGLSVSGTRVFFFWGGGGWWVKLGMLGKP